MNGSQQKAGFYGGVFGGVAGGFTWLAMTGFIIHRPLVALAALAAAGVTILAALLAFKRFPARQLTLTGLVIIWVVIVNLIFIPRVYDAIPASVGGMTTGKEVFSEMKLMLLVGALSLLGFFMIYLDLKRGS